MKFAELFWLLAGLIVCAALIWAWWRYDARQRVALAAFASPHLHEQLTASVSAAARRWRRGLLLAAAALLFVALARPQAGFRWEEVKRRGVEVIFAVDVSRSMQTPDVKPDRLTRAKLAVDDLVQRMDGDGVGLIAFAGNAFLQCPITLDYDAFHDSLAALDTTIIPRGGTDIASAINEAQIALQNRPSTDRLLILLTDGEDLEGSALTAAKAAAKTGLRIFTIGVGTASGDLIPLGADQGGGFVKDDAGQFVKSRLDESGLKAIAEATDGRYAPLGPQGQGLETIYQQAIAPLAKHDLASRRQRVYTERYQWPLAAALVLLLASVPIGTRRRRPRQAAAPARKSVRPPLSGALAALGLGVLALIPWHQAKASPATAESAYHKGDYTTAERDYAAAAKKDAQQPALQFNTGTAAYKAGQFPQAAAAFQKSLGGDPSANPKRLAAQEDAYYNLGNTFYRTGQKTESSKPEETIKTWEQAVKTYDAALQLRATDADAKFNRDFVQKKLDELKKQQQQKQDQQKKDQEMKDQQKKDQDKKGQPKPDQKDQGQKNQSDQKPGDKNQPDKKSGQQPSPPNPADKGNQTSPNPPPGGKDQTKPQPGQPKEPSAGQNGTKPDQTKQPGPAADQAQSAADAQSEPGQMSKAEAKALLDSMKDEEHPLPTAPVARGQNAPQPDRPIKDW
ncbi:MAG: VWA domain-containing protein [Opitutaceae bacterium]